MGQGGGRGTEDTTGGPFRWFEWRPSCGTVVVDAHHCISSGVKEELRGNRLVDSRSRGVEAIGLAVDRLIHREPDTLA